MAVKGSVPVALSRGALTARGRAATGASAPRACEGSTDASRTRASTIAKCGPARVIKAAISAGDDTPGLRAVDIARKMRDIFVFVLLFDLISDD